MSRFMRTPANIYVAVVDDDESICRSFSRLLRAAGFHPISYRSAEAFLDDRNHPRFDCLVLDIQLEGISGLELSRRLTAVNDGTPVIFITAHEDPKAHLDAQSVGCAAFFRKTDPGDSVVNTIRRVIGIRSGETEAGSSEKAPA
jgi:FixJ family two-component response regulator